MKYFCWFRNGQSRGHFSLRKFVDTCLKGSKKSELRLVPLILSVKRYDHGDLEVSISTFGNTGHLWMRNLAGDYGALYLDGASQRRLILAGFQRLLELKKVFDEISSYTLPTEEEAAMILFGEGA